MLPTLEEIIETRVRTLWNARPTCQLARCTTRAPTFRQLRRRSTLAEARRSPGAALRPMRSRCFRLSDHYDENPVAAAVNGHNGVNDFLTGAVIACALHFTR